MVGSICTRCILMGPKTCSQWSQNTDWMWPSKTRSPYSQTRLECDSKTRSEYPQNTAWMCSQNELNISLSPYSFKTLPKRLQNADCISHPHHGPNLLFSFVTRSEWFYFKDRNWTSLLHVKIFLPKKTATWFLFFTLLDIPSRKPA